VIIHNRLLQNTMKSLTFSRTLWSEDKDKDKDL